MHKFRFFIKSSEIRNDEAFLPKKEAHHITDVLRMKKDDTLELFDGKGKVYQAQIAQISPLKLIIQDKREFKIKKKLDIAVALPKAKKMDLIVRQLTEIGCNRIICFTSAKSVPVLNGEKIEKRLERWNKIAIEASKQAHREYVPYIELTDFDKLTQSVQLPIFTMYEKGKKMVKDCIYTGLDRATVIIGPEAGFTKEEVELLKSRGSVFCSLGRYILRVETAAVYTAAYFSAEMDLAGIK